MKCKTCGFDNEFHDLPFCGLNCAMEYVDQQAGKIERLKEEKQKAYRVIMDLLTETCDEETCQHTDCAVARGMDYIILLAAQPQKGKDNEKFTH